VKLTRKEILAIAQANMLSFIHESTLAKFAEQIIAAEKAKNNG
jgi:hypothetical protein